MTQYIVRVSHPDLAPLLWTVPGESAEDCLAKIREFDADRVERLVRDHRHVQPKPISGADLNLFIERIEEEA